MQIPSPSNFEYDATYQTLSWDGVVDADEYEIQYRLDDPTSSWGIAYSGGNDTECSFKKPKGKYKSRGRAKSQNNWGDYGLEETVIVP